MLARKKQEIVLYVLHHDAIKIDLFLNLKFANAS